MKDYKEPEMDVVVTADEELNNVNGGVQLGSCHYGLDDSCPKHYWLPNEEQGAQ